jgi:hypothetical protein
MKRGRGKPYFFKMLIQFSQENIVPDLPVSNNDAFHTEKTVLVPFT